LKLHPGKIKETGGANEKGDKCEISSTP